MVGTVNGVLVETTAAARALPVVEIVGPAGAGKTALLAALVFGTVGFISGLLRGAREGRGSREFVMGPVKPGEKSSEDWGEGRRRR